MMPSPTRSVSTSPRAPLTLPVRPSPRAVYATPAPKTPSSPSSSPTTSDPTTSPEVSLVGVNHGGRIRQRRPAVPPSPSARKRAASELSTAIGSETASTRNEDMLASGGDGGGAPRSSDSLGSICLCPPEPKIPRPRNAFMLYRQHYQAGVVARHPGLANPEISKIIGRQWREEDQEVKDTWDDLAEKEKIRHHQQYPNYKYQPRRKGNKKPSSLSYIDSSFASHGPDDARSPSCARCGRRSLATPGTPLTPYAPAPLTLPPPTPSTAASSSGNNNSNSGGLSGNRYLPPVHLPMNTAPGLQRRGPRFPLVGVSGSPMYPRQITPGSEEMEALTPLTPDAKRRRFSAYHGSLPPPAALAGGAHHQGDRRESLPRSELLSGRMHPPPRPDGPHGPHNGGGMQHGPVDPTLTLPPLQTSTATASATAHTRSVEAMVMTIPYLNKIKVLSRISPALAPPGPTSPIHRLRGAIVAIEGEDPVAVTQVTRWLEAELGRGTGGDSTVIRIVQPDPEPASDLDDSATGGFVRYLKSIAGWHARSKEMVEFITTPLPPPSRSSQSSEEADDSANQNSSPANPTTITANTSTTAGTPLSSSATPVVLIPGYMLTRSNLAAKSIPINDAYAPVDHWTWAATLWRGIVGADLTIWIKECEPEEVMRSGVGVEVREGENTLCVRRERGEEVEGRVLRRLGFEVGEAIRAVASRKIVG